MKLRFLSLLLAAATVATSAFAQVYVYNGDVGFGGSVAVGTTPPSSAAGHLEIGLDNNFGGSNTFGLSLSTFLPFATDVFFYGSSNTNPFSTAWSAGDTTFSFSLTATNVDLYSGIAGDAIVDTLIGTGSFTLNFTTVNQYAAIPGDFTGLASQKEYNPDAHGFGFTPFVSLVGSLVGTAKVGSDNYNYNLALSYAPGTGLYAPAYSTPVPEPSTYGMIGVAVLAGIVALRRRRA